MKYKNILLVTVFPLIAISTQLSYAQINSTVNRIKVSDNIFTPTELSVLDLNNLLTRDEINSVNSQLRNIYEKTKIKIAVVTIPAKYLEKTTGKEYSLRLAQKWKSNQSEDKLVFLIAGNKNDTKNRFARFEINNHLASKISNYNAENIIKTYVVPELKNGNYFQAITKGIEKIKIINNDKKPETILTLILIGFIIAFFAGSIGLIFLVISFIRKILRKKSLVKSNNYSVSSGVTGSYIADTYTSDSYSSGSDYSSSSDSSSSSDFSGSGGGSDW